MWLLFPIVKLSYQTRSDNKFHFRKYEKFYLDTAKAEKALTEMILNDLTHPDIQLSIRHFPHMKIDYSTGYLLVVPFDFKRVMMLKQRAGICKLNNDLKVPINEIKILAKIIVHNQQENVIQPMLIEVEH